MHGLTRAVARRLRALELLVGTIAAPETPAETSRRHELVKAAHFGNVPEDLRDEERAVFARIVATVPIARELVNEGIVDAHGEPAGAVDPHDVMALADEDG